ncbi:MAG: type I 3-dehydroquinate dehydratase [Candidatus Omnitrophica bacterium]|nr:type I 3-dehydroquinate dehydratase [Candidatus Omnitrophota bacterium]
MIRLASLRLGGIPRVAVSLKDRIPPHAIDDAKRFGVDIIELRIDQYASFEKKYVLQEVKKNKGFPKIATIRSRREGGRWNQSEETRLVLFQAVMPYVDAVDIELSSKEIMSQVIQEARKKNKLVIVSHHDFDRTPEDKKLKQILNQAKKLGADIVKIAALVLKREDTRRLASFTIMNAHKNLISIGMGTYGASTRVLFPGLGSLITYASIGEPTAPGQLDYRTTVEFLRKLYPDYHQAQIASRCTQPLAHKTRP